MNNKFNISWFTLKVVTWLTVAFKLELTRSLSDFLGLVRSLEKIENNNGKIYLTKFCKAVRLSLSRYLAGQPFKSNEIDAVRLTVDGIPIILGPWIPSLRSQTITSDSLKLLMTILNMTRALNLGREPDFDPITRASMYILPSNLEKNVKLFWKELGYNRNSKTTPSRAYFSQYHQSSKVSPYIADGTLANKKNALWHSIGDLLALPDTLIDSIKIVGGPLLTEKINTLKEAVVKIPELSYLINITKSNNIRKISYFPDRELKVRIIAVGDYFSQTALRPLHQYLFRILKRLPQDMTFHQGEFKTSYKIHNKFYSLDLTAATDRFPIELIRKVLEGRFPKEYTNAWQDIMVGYPFYSNGEYIKYSVGNPMGFYSSWASFALAHHFVMFNACKNLNIEWKTAPYYLLGDDVVICDESLALEYKGLIKDLGLEISEPKSFVSNHFFEFAKRLFYKGEEITPFPISAMRESLKSVTAFVGLLFETENKGWVACSAPSEAIRDAYGSISNYRSKYRNKLEVKAYVADRILRSIRGSLPVGEAVKAVFGKLGYPFEVVTDKVGNSLLENIVVDLFSQQPEMKPIDKDEPAYFSLASDLVMLLTGLDDTRIALGFDVIQALPVTQVFGQIEEVYMSLNKKARDISTKGGDWPLLFKSLAIPSSDRIFSERSSKTITRISGKVSNALAERAQILMMYPQLLREKHTNAIGRPLAPLSGNPYEDYKIRVLKAYLSFILKFVFGLIFGITCVGFLTKYMSGNPETIVQLIEQSQGPIGTLPIGDSIKAVSRGVEIFDSLYLPIIYTEIGIILSAGIIVTTSVIVILTIVPLVAPALLWYSPILYLGLFS